MNKLLYAYFATVLAAMSAFLCGCDSRKQDDADTQTKAHTTLRIPQSERAKYEANLAASKQGDVQRAEVVGSDRIGPEAGAVVCLAGTAIQPGVHRAFENHIEGDAVRDRDSLHARRRAHLVGDIGDEGASLRWLVAVVRGVEHQHRRVLRVKTSINLPRSSKAQAEDERDDQEEGGPGHLREDKRPARPALSGAAFTARPRAAQSEVISLACEVPFVVSTTPLVGGFSPVSSACACILAWSNRVADPARAPIE